MKRREIGIGVVGGGYMGKAHSVALSAVGAVFDTALRPRLEMICTSTYERAAASAARLGFARSTGNWRDLVDNPRVEAVVIASPQNTHRAIAEGAFAAGKPVFCEKPLGQGLAESRAMASAAASAGIVNMVGFNYIRTPASQLAREILASGEIGDVVHFRGEHTEDFFADAEAPATWRSFGRANGTMGDLAPHMVNASAALVGPIRSLVADINTAVTSRPAADGADPVQVTNDDQGQLLCRFENGARGMLHFSRIAAGRKMGYAYEIVCSRGALRFDQEDQNALWLYEGAQPEARQGFKKILTGPAHPDYVNFCEGPGHGTGYQDQIIIEMRDFLSAIETGTSIWPTFEDGVYCNQVIEAAWMSHDAGRWIDLAEV